MERISKYIKKQHDKIESLKKRVEELEETKKRVQGVLQSRDKQCNDLLKENTELKAKVKRG